VIDRENELELRVQVLGMKFDAYVEAYNSLQECLQHQPVMNPLLEQSGYHRALVSTYLCSKCRDSWPCIEVIKAFGASASVYLRLGERIKDAELTALQGNE
jgi:hypothetical protein